MKYNPTVHTTEAVLNNATLAKELALTSEEFAYSSIAQNEEALLSNANVLAFIMAKNSPYWHKTPIMQDVEFLKKLNRQVLPILLEERPEWAGSPVLQNIDLLKSADVTYNLAQASRLWAQTPAAQNKDVYLKHEGAIARLLAMQSPEWAMSPAAQDAELLAMHDSTLSYILHILHSEWRKTEAGRNFSPDPDGLRSSIDNLRHASPLFYLSDYAQQKDILCAEDGQVAYDLVRKYPLWAETPITQDVDVIFLRNGGVFDSLRRNDKWCSSPITQNIDFLNSIAKKGDESETIALGLSQSRAWSGTPAAQIESVLIGKVPTNLACLSGTWHLTPAAQNNAVLLQDNGWPAKYLAALSPQWMQTEAAARPEIKQVIANVLYEISGNVTKQAQCLASPLFPESLGQREEFWLNKDYNFEFARNVFLSSVIKTTTRPEVKKWLKSPITQRESFLFHNDGEMLKKLAFTNSPWLYTPAALSKAVLRFNDSHIIKNELMQNSSWIEYFLEHVPNSMAALIDGAGFTDVIRYKMGELTELLFDTLPQMARTGHVISVQDVFTNPPEIVDRLRNMLDDQFLRDFTTSALEQAVDGAPIERLTVLLAASISIANIAVAFSEHKYIANDLIDKTVNAAKEIIHQSTESFMDISAFNEKVTHPSIMNSVKNVLPKWIAEAQFNQVETTETEIIQPRLY